MWPACGAATIIATNCDWDAVARVIRVLHSNQFLISCTQQLLRLRDPCTIPSSVPFRALMMINDMALGGGERRGREKEWEFDELATLCAGDRPAP